MEALRAAGVGGLFSTKGGGSAVSSTFDGGHCVRFSSSAVFGGPLRQQVMRKRASGACACVGTISSAVGTLYSVLGVELGGSFSDIKSAYKQMARRYHPDVCPVGDRDACTQKFLEVRHAYEILSDPEKRAEYDYALMHPSFAQALGNSPTSSWGRSRRTQGSEGASDAWRFQWEAQLSRLRRDSDLPISSSNSWGARMRREKSEYSIPL